MSVDILSQLTEIIEQRRAESAEKSYTKQLLDGGVGRCGKKLGEEAVELVIAALSEDDDAVKGESADLIYHLLVLLAARGIAIDDVLEVLAGRMGLSGLEEKASRAE